MTPHNNPEWWVITPTTLEKVAKYGSQTLHTISCATVCFLTYMHE